MNWRGWAAWDNALIEGITPTFAPYLGKLCLLRFETSSCWLQVRSVTSWGLPGRSHRPWRQTRHTRSGGYSLYSSFICTFQNTQTGYTHKKFPSLEKRKRHVLYSRNGDNSDTATETYICATAFLWGTSGGAFRYDTALQAGKSRVRFRMVPLEIFIDIILPAALWPWDRLSL